MATEWFRGRVRRCTSERRQQEQEGQRQRHRQRRGLRQRFGGSKFRWSQPVQPPQPRGLAGSRSLVNHNAGNSCGTLHLAIYVICVFSGGNGCGDQMHARSRPVPVATRAGSVWKSKSNHLDRYHFIPLHTTTWHRHSPSVSAYSAQGLPAASACKCGGLAAAARSSSSRVASRPRWTRRRHWLSSD